MTFTTFSLWVWTVWLAPLNTASHERAGIKVTVAECWQDGTQWKAAENRRLGLKRAEGGKINRKSSCQGAADMTESKQKQAELTAVSAVHFCSWLMSGEAALYVCFLCLSCCHFAFLLKHNVFHKVQQNIYLLLRLCDNYPRWWYFEEVNQC